MSIKDLNDLLVANVEISSLPLVSIDIYVAQQLLKQYPEDTQAQQKAIEKFSKTIRNPLVKSDLANLLVKTWGKELGDIKEFLSIANVKSADEKLNDVADIFDCFSALDTALDEEEFGIGYEKVDANVMLRKKWVVILGAYSFSGKTHNLIEWILHWVIRLRKRVLFHSLEMPKEDVMEIIIAKLMKVPQYKVKEIIKTTKGAEVYRDVSEKIGKYLYIVDKNSLSMDDIEDYLKLVNSRLSDHPIDIVAVDYFSYLAKTTTFDEASESARRMKEIAKTNNITLVMLSQFNKQSQYSDKGGKVRKPTQNDLKGTGDIGASADVIYLIWRPALMGNMSITEADEQKYLTCLKVAKARKGLKQGQSCFELYYNPETSRLSEKS